MDTWIYGAKWLHVGVATIAAIVALIIGALTWLLNHPD